MNSKYKALYPIFFGLLTYNLISTFLSGQIINIPHGTLEGGIIAATGVGTIMIFMVIAGFTFFRLTKKKIK